ncbi:hypothetical protein C7451_101461 [Blastomonas natatoria]|uniref:Uncharacterized protein n=1 Tax=Blastomonas natatoria TaxID=34015 RepID=A0A2V3VDX9_9SPHN|nr:hypothetical protein [Blastomonas natatoria]PXW79394.1 hypothetical protein C7451_101461 [Blastomonas natatoria]
MVSQHIRTRLLIGGAMALFNMALIAGLAISTLSMPAFAQGQNRNIVEKPSRAVACPSGWRTPDGDTDRCEPMGTLAPKIYAKKEGESCASGYHEVYRLWCSTRKP